MNDTIRQSAALVLFIGMIITLFTVLLSSGTEKTKKTEKRKKKNMSKDVIIQKVVAPKNDDDKCSSFTASTSITCDQYCNNENLYAHCLDSAGNCFETNFTIQCACTSSDECAPTPSST